jgi:hypothetical protein
MGHLRLSKSMMWFRTQRRNGECWPNGLAREGLHLNEIDPLRAEALAALFPQATVTSFDAARIASHVTNQPSVIVMNPLFARSASVMPTATQRSSSSPSALRRCAPGPIGCCHA